MIQVNILNGDNSKELMASVNDFLKTLDDEAVMDIKVDELTWTAVVQYKVIEAWTKAKCYDCKYWDDDGDPSAVSGMCHECGQRRRFNCKACARFYDIRG